MKIGIVYNLVDAIERGFESDLIADNEVQFNVKHVRNALKHFHEVIPIRIHRNSFKSLNLKKIDFIFNLCEGLEGNVEDEALMAAFFHLNRIPFTGADHYSLSLCLNKAKTKQFLAAAHIQTPDSQVYYSPSDDFLHPIPYPLIIKPLHEDASIGISFDSVVYDEDTLRKRVAWVIEHYRQPALVEEYIDGREINATLLGNGLSLEVLPITELHFNFPASLPHIIDYNAKWVDTSFSFQNITGVCPAQLTPSEEKKIRQTAIDAFRITECRDYARIDFRLRGDQLYVLEVNPNPSINPKSGFFRSAAASGLTYPQLIQKILKIAQKRYSNSALLPPAIEIDVINPPYSSPQLDFTAITMKDIRYIHAWMNSSLMSEYLLKEERIYTRDDLIVQFLLSDDNYKSWIITDRKNLKKIGLCTLHLSSLGTQSGEISILLGTTTEHTSALVEEILGMLKAVAFHKFGLNRLTIYSPEFNKCLELALQHEGFVNVGLIHKIHRIHGERMNVVLYEYSHFSSDY